MNKVKVVGVMSGSSLDGIDMALCDFEIENTKGENFQIGAWNVLKTETIPMPSNWKIMLKDLPNVSAIMLAQADADFGTFIGKTVKEFLTKSNNTADFIASHGHTIFHTPEKLMTCQIGNGGHIAAFSGIDTISDFRTTDIALSGQGTPLVPTAEKYLFEGYDFYLNIGGIANISARNNDNMIAFDVCPANQVLNGLASRLGFDYDNNGDLAKSGDINPELLTALEMYPFFKKGYPKSLDNEWITKNFLQNILMQDCNTQDKLRTTVELIAIQVAQALKMILEKEAIPQKEFKMMLTGGGVYNQFLVERIQFQTREICNLAFSIPSDEIIQFKEAILMAFIGSLRLMGINNCLSSVTGSTFDSCGGALYLSPKPHAKPI